MHIYNCVTRSLQSFAKLHDLYKGLAAQDYNNMQGKCCLNDLQGKITTGGCTIYALDQVLSTTHGASKLFYKITLGDYTYGSHASHIVPLLYHPLSHTREYYLVQGDQFWGDHQQHGRIPHEEYRCY